jgi:hypothetical protein
MLPWKIGIFKYDILTAILVRDVINQLKNCRSKRSPVAELFRGYNYKSAQFS